MQSSPLKGLDSQSPAASGPNAGVPLTEETQIVLLPRSPRENSLSLPRCRGPSGKFPVNLSLENSAGLRCPKPRCILPRISYRSAVRSRSCAAWNARNRILSSGKFVNAATVVQANRAGGDLPPAGAGMYTACSDSESPSTMPKRTFQPNRRHRSKTHGFRVRMRTQGGRAVLSRRRAKGRKRVSVKPGFRE